MEQVDIDSVMAQFRHPDYRAYRDILFVIPYIDPNRKSQDSVGFGQLEGELLNRDRHYSSEELREAAANMVDAGIIKLIDDTRFRPTEDGEQLIDAIHPSKLYRQSLPPFPRPVRRVA